MNAEDKVRSHIGSDIIPRKAYYPAVWKLIVAYGQPLSDSVKNEIRANNSPPPESPALQRLRDELWLGKNFGFQVEYVALLLKYGRGKKKVWSAADMAEIASWMDPNRVPGSGPRLP